MPCHKCKQCLLVTESLCFDGGVRGNAVQIEVCRGSDQIASSTLGNEGEGKVQGVSLGRRGKQAAEKACGIWKRNSKAYPIAK